MRSYAREVAFAKNYQLLISGEYLSDDYAMFEEDKLTDNDKEFIESVMKNIITNTESINNTIGQLSHAFKLDRIYRIDLAILQVALAEIQYVKTPVPVAINEAVNIAKKYSTPKSIGFVNGILAQYVRNNGNDGE